jgi:hypothetical protein
MLTLILTLTLKSLEIEFDLVGTNKNVPSWSNYCRLLFLGHLVPTTIVKHVHKHTHTPFISYLYGPGALILNQPSYTLIYLMNTHTDVTTKTQLKINEKVHDLWLKTILPKPIFPDIIKHTYSVKGRGRIR